MRSQFTPKRIAIIKKMTTNADKDAEKLDVSFTAGSTINSITALKKITWQSLQN